MKTLNKEIDKDITNLEESFKVNWSEKEKAVKLLEQEKIFNDLDIEVFK